MKVKEFNQLKKQVKEGNVEGLNQEVIKSLTLRQAQSLENVVLDNIPLNDEINGLLDDIVIHISNLVEAEKVANKKAPAKPDKTEAPIKPEKVKPKKTEKVKPFDRVNVGDTVYFRVEGEEIDHEILIVYKGKKSLIAIMKEDEREVFPIGKTEFNKQVFAWKDRHNEEYNIIVTI